MLSLVVSCEAKNALISISLRITPLLELEFVLSIPRPSKPIEPILDKN